MNALRRLYRTVCDMSDTQCRCSRSDRADVLRAVKRHTTMRRSGGLSGADVAARPLRSPYQSTRAADSVRIALYAVFVIAYGKDNPQIWTRYGA